MVYSHRVGVFLIWVYLMWTDMCMVEARLPVKIRRLKKAQEELLSQLTKDNQYEILANVVTPLWNYSYEEQLRFKEKYTMNIVNKLKVMTKNTTGAACKIRKIIASPDPTAYRNKDEFNIRNGIDGNPKTVGYYVGKPSIGNIVCVRPFHLKNLKPRHVEIARLFEEYITQSPLPASYHFQDGGFWRKLIVRSNRRGDIMAAVITSPANLSEHQIKEESMKMRDYMVKTEPDLILYHQVCPHTRCTDEVAPFKLLNGEPFLYEYLGKFKFGISASSFFQVNTAVAELLYSEAFRLANLKRHTTLLDLCCGTGTISILAADEVRGSVGIDILPQCIRDAKYNANLNKVTNCKFIAGNLETVLPKVLADIESSPDVVVILNPGRAGVPKAVITQVRAAVQINRLVYIACKADAADTFRNFLELGNKDSKIKNKPFDLTKVIPLDMFPQTDQTELILLFESIFAMVYSYRSGEFLLWAFLIWNMCIDMSMVQGEFRNLSELRLSFSKKITKENQDRMLADIVTSLWNNSYEEQLQIKQKFVTQFVNNLKNHVHSNVKREVNIRSIIESPVQFAYRNKDEYSIGYSFDGKPKTLGFHYTRTICIRPDNLKCVKPRHLEIFRMFQEYIVQSLLPASYRIQDGGFWRELIIRSNRRGDTMAIVITSNPFLPNSRITEEVIKLRDYVIKREPNLTLYHQTCIHTRCAPEYFPFRLLNGEQYLYEYIGKHKFRISPSSFFQVNIDVAELLYNEVFKLANLTQDTILLDLCCGTGTMSVLAADKVHGCIGIDIQGTNIRDAEDNAKLNNVTNCNFILGSLQSVLMSTLRKIPHWVNVAVILNPGRAGVSKSVITTLRSSVRIQRIVYVACDISSESTFNNFVDLQEDNWYIRNQFHLTEVVPLDMFPYTKFVETVLLFER